MKVDTLIKNGLTVLEGSVRRLSIGITAGRIVSLADDESELVARDEVIHADRFIVLPGIIEPHCHFWDPGPTDREDWQTGTASAAAGGITTCMEMPLSVPPTVDEASFRLKQARASDLAIVDYALWGGIVPDSSDDLLERLDALEHLGAVAYKAFLCWSAKEFPPIDDGLLLASMGAIDSRHGVLGLHAENDAIIARCERALQNEDRRDGQAHVESRPEIAEVEAIGRAIALSEATGARIYIVHMSTARGAELVRQAKARGVHVHAETAPQYLILDSKELDRLGPYAKCAPPLRARTTVDALWRHVLSGCIDTIGSDHAPFTIAEKELGVDNIWKAPNGLQGIQTLVPLVFSEGIHNRGMGLVHLAQLLSTNAARIFGLYPQKGTIQVGSDADLTIVDPDSVWTIDAKDLKYKNRWSPYEGMQVRCIVARTIVRGVTVYKDGIVVGNPGYGVQVTPRKGRANSGIG